MRGASDHTLLSPSPRRNTAFYRQGSVGLTKFPIRRSSRNDDNHAVRLRAFRIIVPRLVFRHLAIRRFNDMHGTGVCASTVRFTHERYEFGRTSVFSTGASAVRGGPERGLQNVPSPRLGRGGIVRQEGPVEVRHGHPVRRVLEARHVEDENLVRGGVVGSQWRKMAVPRLSQDGAAETDYDNAIRFHRGGRIAGGLGGA